MRENVAGAAAPWRDFYGRKADVPGIEVNQRRTAPHRPRGVVRRAALRRRRAGGPSRRRRVLTHSLALLAGAFLASSLASRRALDATQPSTASADASAFASASGFDWRQHPPPSFPIPPYARFLMEARIVLDPGHVGQVDRGGGWKRGPTGLREAEVNLRVAQFLAEFLRAAGAEVVLTRERDESLGLPDAEDLRARAEVANRLRADLLLSIHHNAAETDANFTTVFYHAGPDHSPASLSAARHILTGLNDALRLEQHIDCPIATDYTIYRSDGFAVLRHARVPAVLSEASFFSNPAEERRLRDPLYNRREAYGLFLGLARWAQAGLPAVRLESRRGGRGATATVRLEDGLSRRGGFGSASLKIIPDSLVVRIDGAPARVTPDWDRRLVNVELPAGVRRAKLYVDFETITGQHVLHPYIELDAE